MFFHEGKGSRLRSGATNPEENLRPAVTVYSNATNATEVAVAPTPSMGGSHAIRPSARRDASRTDVFVDTCLVHATCEPNARRESRRSEAAFTTERLRGVACLLQTV